MLNNIAEILNQFQSVSLKDMDKVSLMKRKDSKYIFNINQLPIILEEIKTEYLILEINNERLFKYNTCYYDTPDLDLYHFHHNQRLNRYKVREREYAISNDLYLEIKHKTNKKITIKDRTKISESNNSISNDNKSNLLKNININPDNLEQKLNNSFKRITLVNFKNNERITIDINLSFYNSVKEFSLNDLVIAEIKYDAYNKSNSLITEVLRKNNIRPNRISKYCIGTILLNDNIKYNRFKSKLLTINKICNGKLNIK